MFSANFCKVFCFGGGIHFFWKVNNSVWESYPWKRSFSHFVHSLNLIVLFLLSFHTLLFSPYFLLSYHTTIHFLCLEYKDYIFCLWWAAFCVSSPPSESQVEALLPPSTPYGCIWSQEIKLKELMRGPDLKGWVSLWEDTPRNSHFLSGFTLRGHVRTEREGSL